MGNQRTLDTFFRKRNVIESEVGIDAPLVSNENTADGVPLPLKVDLNEHPPKHRRIESDAMDVTTLERDPALRPLMWEIPVNQRREIQCAYLKAGPYQPRLSEYPFLGSDNHRRRFQVSWFDAHSTWLEYSPITNSIYCLPCYLFCKKPIREGLEAFTVRGFNNWKKVNDGVNCALLSHIGKDLNSSHGIAVKCCEDLVKQPHHIYKLIKKQTSQEIENNRLRLKATIDSVRWLAFQACAFRGHDESASSEKPGNFIELVKLLATYNDKVANVVLENAKKNAKYTSHKIQKEILHILASKVRAMIREEIGDAKFCIIIDEARDEAKREQMAIILRFVDKDGFIRERFFHVVHVKDTNSLTLKKEVCDVLSRYDLHVENIRGQGYDGASNMRGEWNGLQALFIQDCPYAYYVHCMAHRLQLALVVASREVKHVHQFFTTLSMIINIVVGSCKRNDELREAQTIVIENMIANDEIETGKGANQLGTLQRVGDTRWGSHFQSICSLLRMFNATCFVVNIISKKGANYSQRGEAEAAYIALTSFEFVFILHMMKNILGITNTLCRALQQKSQDILNAMQLVSTTKTLIEELRADGWRPLLASVEAFCLQNNIEIPDLKAAYTRARGKFRQRVEPVTLEHHFKFDIFYSALDSQWNELKSRFCDQTLKLLTLSSSLTPNNGYSSFNIDDICNLVDKFYPKDFTLQDKVQLRFQLQHYKIDIPKHPDFQSLSTISELCRALEVSGKSKIYHLVDRLVRLVLTLPVSTATTERAFSAMKLIKTRLRSRMEDEYLADNLVVYIEKEIAKNFTTDMIMDEFYALGNRRA